MRRTVIPELLDTDAGTPQEIQDSLADLRMVNRYFGGLHTMTALIRQVAAREQVTSLSFLDVGGGSGDLMALTAQSLKKSGIELRPVILDRVAGHIATPTRSKAARVPGVPDIDGRYPAVAGDALELPFKDNSFDVVGCCLFLHHLEPQQVVQFVNRALRVARHAVVINDLIRHPLHLAMIYAGYTIYRSRITRHDSVASVRRAYTVEEVRSMLQQTGAREVSTQKFFLFRMGVIVWKQPHTI
jgi:ubiquinone/menaquinone biosynthesis C-methylase UbiE